MPRSVLPVPAGTNHTEVHTCQPIGLDKVMFVLNGLPPRLLIVNIKTGAVEVNHEIPYHQAYNPNYIHGQFRRARLTAQGTYLVSYLNESNVVEYDMDFNKVWSYPIRSPWAALRLKNGNTLITDEHDSLTREVNPKGETVWECKNTDLPEAYRWFPRRKAAPVWPTATPFSVPAAGRQRPATGRSDAGQKGRLGAAGLERPRRRHRRADS